MTDTKMSSKLEMRWVPVVDARGRTHMEAVWFEPAKVARPRVTHAA